MEHLGSRLAAARRAAGVSRVDLAHAAGLHPVHIRKIELNERPNLALATATALARAMGAELDWLANGVGPAPDNERVATSVASALEAARAAKAAA